MHRIDGAGHVNNLFVNEDPATNRPPTEVTPEILNALQEEIVGVILAAQIALVKGDNTQLLAALQTLFSPRSAGAVQFFAMSTAPAGWLKANGAAVSRTSYASLFASIGTVFGVGDGATTFHLPDLRGEFLRGWDDARGVDGGRVLGSAQQSSLFPGYTSVNGGLVSLGGAIQNIEPTTVTANHLGDISNNSTSFSDTYSAIRPRNIALLACIKY